MPQLAVSNFDDLIRLNDLTIFLLLVRTATICDGDSKILVCPTGHVIEIRAVFYGRLDQVTCRKEGFMGDTSCRFAAAIDIVRTYCQNNVTCQLMWAGTDPCPGTHKYLRVTFVCRGK